MYEDVVIGWDGRPPAEEAVEWAVRRPIGHRYRLVRVVDDTRAERDAPSPAELEAAAEHAVREEVDELARTHPSIRITGEVAIGDAAPELERRTGQAALLVLGSDRVPHAAPRVRWTASARIAAHAHGPVVVVPAGTRDRPGHVLVGVDTTAASRAAALRAAEFATATFAPLVVLHAWQAQGEPDDPAAVEPPLDGFGVDADHPDDDPPSRTLPEAHAEVLRAAVAEVRMRYPRLHVTGRLVHESAPRALLEAAGGAALLVLGRHSRWSSSALLLGSVTHELLLSSPAPVLVVGRRDVPLLEPVTPQHEPAEVLGSSRQVVG
ncbi:universal stress protein [Amnibacterium sp.]|uniref:universal stress protein n=1 Tax=Amnibacterium sp. TaxID=1872496 RepID=UPI003F7C295E